MHLGLHLSRYSWGWRRQISLIRFLPLSGGCIIIGKAIGRMPWVLAAASLLHGRLLLAGDRPAQQWADFNQHGAALSS